MNGKLFILLLGKCHLAYQVVLVLEFSPEVKFSLFKRQLVTFSPESGSFL